MKTLDDLRQKQPDLGFAIYAYAPGGPVTLEVHTPMGDVFTWKAPTEAEALAQAFPEPDAPEVNIFD